MSAPAGSAARSGQGAPTDGCVAHRFASAGRLAGASLVAIGSVVLLHGLPFDWVAVLLVSGVSALVLNGQVRWRSVARFARDFLPLVLLLVAYELSRGAADTLGMPIRIDYPIRFDRTLFGTVPSVWLQQHLYVSDEVAVWEIPVSLVYASHFFVVPIAAVVLWNRGRQRFRHFVVMIGAITIGALVLFILVPTAPPWLAARNGSLSYITRSSGRGWSLLHIPIAERLLRHGQSSVNLVAAMPSLHAAYSLAVALFFGQRRSATTRAILLLYPCLMGFVLVLTAEHYVADVFGGWVLTGICFAGVEWWSARHTRVPVS